MNLTTATKRIYSLHVVVQHSRGPAIVKSSSEIFEVMLLLLFVNSRLVYKDTNLTHENIVVIE